jgi:ribosomal protein L21
VCSIYTLLHKTAPRAASGETISLKPVLTTSVGGLTVSKKMVEQTLVEIEETQKALRNSIEQTKQLAEKSEQLIQRHREELRKPH